MQAPPAESGAQPQLKSILEHFSHQTSGGNNFNHFLKNQGLNVFEDTQSNI